MWAVHKSLNSYSKKIRQLNVTKTKASPLLMKVVWYLHSYHLSTCQGTVVWSYTISAGMIVTIIQFMWLWSRHCRQICELLIVSCNSIFHINEMLVICHVYTATSTTGFPGATASKWLQIVQGVANRYNRNTRPTSIEYFREIKMRFVVSLVPINLEYKCIKNLNQRTNAAMHGWLLILLTHIIEKTLESHFWISYPPYS